MLWASCCIFCLTGQHPAGPGLHSTAELVKAIVECEPPQLSNTTTCGDAKVIGRKAGFDAGKTSAPAARRLGHDCWQGSEEESRRSATHQSPALADDLQRYLKHEPISARPDTFAYRAAKFLRRNRTVVALTAIAIALVIGSLSAGLYVANRERKIAERRFAQVRQLANKFIALDNNIRGLPGSTQSQNANGHRFAAISDFAGQ